MRELRASSRQLHQITAKEQWLWYEIRVSFSIAFAFITKILIFLSLVFQWVFDNIVTSSSLD